MFDHDESWTDLDIWRYAQEHERVIVTKDADFSDWAMLSEPPPKVVHLRIGNMRMRDSHRFMEDVWSNITVLVEAYKLVIVYADRIECVD